MVRIGETELAAGDRIAIEGTTGKVTADDVPLVDPEIERASSSEVLRVVGRAAPARRARERRHRRRTPPRRARSAPRASASAAPSTCSSARTGASSCAGCSSPPRAGAGPRCRPPPTTGRRRRSSRARAASSIASLDELGELQRADFASILHEMRGLPVTVRLLDPPLHEFLPLEHFEAEVRRLEAAADDRLTDAREAAEIVRDLQEANPMLGTRGVRLAFLYPQIYEMQVRAVIGAAAEAAEAGDAPQVEIMIPLVAYETELRQLREHVVERRRAGAARAGSEVPYSVGTMIELPRACLIAGHIARHADFFSFGTNDLTQTTIGLSRDDVEGSFMPSYLAGRIIDRSPFEVIDGPGVGELVADRRRARPRRQPRAQARGLRRARRRPDEHPLLRLDRPRLRQLLAVPNAGRAGRGRAGGDRAGRIAITPVRL